MLRGSSGVWNVISPQVNLDKPDKYIVKSTVELSPDVPNWSLVKISGIIRAKLRARTKKERSFFLWRLSLKHPYWHCGSSVLVFTLLWKWFEMQIVCNSEVFLKFTPRVVVLATTFSWSLTKRQWAHVKTLPVIAKLKRTCPISWCGRFIDNFSSEEKRKKNLLCSVKLKKTWQFHDVVLLFTTSLPRKRANKILLCSAT